MEDTPYAYFRLPSTSSVAINATSSVDLISIQLGRFDYTKCPRYRTSRLSEYYENVTRSIILTVLFSFYVILRIAHLIIIAFVGVKKKVKCQVSSHLSFNIL